MAFASLPFCVPDLFCISGISSVPQLSPLPLCQEILPVSPTSLLATQLLITSVTATHLHSMYKHPTTHRNKHYSVTKLQLDGISENKLWLG